MPRIRQHNVLAAQWAPNGGVLGAPDLTNIGSKKLGIDFQVRHLECPSCVNAGSPMPSFKSLGAQALKQLATFLEASKGPK